MRKLNGLGSRRLGSMTSKSKWAMKEVPVSDLELGAGFLGSKLYTGGTGKWPKPGTAPGFGLVKTGHDVILVPSTQKPTGTILEIGKEITFFRRPSISKPFLHKTRFKTILGVGPAITEETGTSLFKYMGIASIFRERDVTVDKPLPDLAEVLKQKELQKKVSKLRDLGRSRRRTIEDIGIRDITEPLKKVGSGTRTGFMPIQTPITTQMVAQKTAMDQMLKQELKAFQEKKRDMRPYSPSTPERKQPPFIPPIIPMFPIKMKGLPKGEGLGAGYGLRIWRVPTPEEVLTGKRKKRK